MEEEETNVNQRGSWFMVPILTPQQFFTEMEKKYLFSGTNQNGCSREEIHEAIASGEHDLFALDPEQDIAFTDALGLNALAEEDKNELLAEWYWEDKVESDYRRDYELLE